jgi:hypothetical protein
MFSPQFCVVICSIGCKWIELGVMMQMISVSSPQHFTSQKIIY